LGPAITVSGIIDTTILIHLFRKNKESIEWIASQKNLGMSSVSRLEFIYGARGKKALTQVINLLSTFETIMLTDADQQWAEQQLIMYRLSHGVEINDSWFASVCYRLQLPIFTQNIKDMQKILSPSLVIRPFVA